MTTPTTIQAKIQLRSDTAANWTSVDPVLLAGELGRETDTGKIKIGDGTTVWTSLAYQAFGGLITDANISATAEIAVSKLADGAARQLLQTDAAGTGVEWTDNVDVPGTLDVTGAGTFDGNVTIAGDLTVNGTTTTINTQDLLVEDKNVVIGNVTTPSDVTADGGGITLKGTTDKTINWVDATDAWTLSEHVDIASGKEYRINGTKVLDATSLGSGVVSSSLTSVGTISSGTWEGTAIDAAYLPAGTTSAAGIVQLEDSTSSTSTTTAATPNAVKSAYDLANAALPASGGTLTGDVTLNAQSDLRFADADSSNWVALQAPATVASNVTWTLPDADGTSGQVLSTDGAGALSWATAAGGATDKIEEGNTSAEVIDSGSDGRFVVTTEGNERARIDSSGRLLVGTSSAVGNELFQVVGGDSARQRIHRNINDQYQPVLHLSKARGTSNEVVVNSDTLGSVYFQGADGTSLKLAASVEAQVDGTPGANDMPGRLIFSTTADGASSPTERMRIGQNANVRITQPNTNADGLTVDSTNGSSTSSTITVTTARAAGTSALFFYGVANAAPAIVIYNNGNIANANNSYTGLSDIKLKENVVDAPSQWDDIKALQVRKYNFKESTGHETHTQIGLVAQEVEQVSPGLVSESPDRDEEGNDLGTVTKSVNYSVLYMKAVKALQEAMERIETLEAKVAALESA